METKENKKIKILLSVLIGLLVLVIAGIAFAVVSGTMEEDDYMAAITTGKKYLAENDYEQAAVQFQNAISLDPKKEDAYLLLADTYEAEGDTVRAGAVLRSGYKATGSANIQNRLARLENKAVIEKMGEKINLADASSDISWDTSFLQKLVNYTFDDYKSEFGKVVSAETDEDGYLEVRHEKLNATCYYRNTEENGKIVNTSLKTPYSTGMPEKMTLDSLGLLFRNFEGGANLSRMQMLFGERVEPEKLDKKIYYIENKEEDLEIKIETDKDGNIMEASPWNELLFPLANKEKGKEGVVAGVVVDAVTGNGVAGAKLFFEPKHSSGSTATAITDSKGTFRIELAADTYKITVSADGYIDETFEFTVKAGESYSGEQFVISPELSGEARIVLEWGAQPRDLDSYLSGSVKSEDDVWIYYGNQQEVIDGEVAVALDLDDQDGYGPETTTIYNLDGVYRFTVADYLSTGTMAENGATVKVYLPGKDPVTITLDSSSGVEDVWDVCIIDHGELEILNRANTDYGRRDANKLSYVDRDNRVYWNRCMWHDSVCYFF